MVGNGVRPSVRLVRNSHQQLEELGIHIPHREKSSHILGMDRQLQRSEDDSLPLALSLAGLGVAIMLMLLHFRSFFLRDADDDSMMVEEQLVRAESLEPAHACKRSLCEAFDDTCMLLRGRPAGYNDAKAGSIAIQMRQQSPLNKGGEAGKDSISPPNLEQIKGLETIVEESLLQDDEEADSVSTTRSLSKWYEVFPSLSYALDPQEDATSIAGTSCDSPTLESSRSSLFEYAKEPPDPLSHVRRTAKTVRASRNEAISSSTVEVRLLRKDPTLKCSWLDTINRSRSDYTVSHEKDLGGPIRTTTMTDSLSESPESEVDSYSWVDSDDCETQSTRSYLSWTASERKAMREAAEELLFRERDWSILLETASSNL